MNQEISESKFEIFIEEVNIEINPENYEWLKKSALFVENNYNSAFFIEYLNLLKDKGSSVDYLGDIFFKILEKSTPTFRQEDIVSIVEFLYTEKKKTEADHICNTYAERGYNFLEGVYRKYTK